MTRNETQGVEYDEEHPPIVVVRWTEEASESAHRNLCSTCGTELIPDHGCFCAAVARAARHDDNGKRYV
jgi:hypothetical protein